MFEKARFAFKHRVPAAASGPVPEAEVATMTRDEAIERMNELWARSLDG